MTTSAPVPQLLTMDWLEPLGDSAESSAAAGPGKKPRAERSRVNRHAALLPCGATVIAWPPPSLQVTRYWNQSPQPTWHAGFSAPGCFVGGPRRPVAGEKLFCRRRDGQSRALPELIDIHTLALRLDDSVRHIRRLVAERRIPYVKVGHFVRFDPEEIAVWLDARRVAVSGMPLRTVETQRQHEGRQHG